ncbi:MAG: type II secretion system F family protein [Peptoniphilaceae bacterium]|nr:type II secretion system F family protein [Peptoniphilaceae bacterium]MDD7382829.1 type II secretion system F family protein [Peptoniphilaceae bacterium]MDY3738212.1 type II secretion system F family protein [Peptoniphilaceae bacterium]
MNLEKIKQILNTDIRSKKISLRVVSLFLKQLSVLINSSIPVDKAVEIIYNQNIDKKLNKSLENIKNSLSKGLDIYEAFSLEEKAFGTLIISFIRSGQKSGHMGDILNDLSNFFESEYENKSKIKQAFAYPILLMIITLIVVFIILKFVFPVFINIFNQSDIVLPLPTKILLKISYFLENDLYILLVCIGFFIIAFYFFSKKENNLLKLYEILYKLPLIGNFKKTKINYQISNLMYILINGRIPIVKSVQIIGDGFNNIYMKDIFKKIENDLLMGNTISKSFSNRKFFSNLFVSMLDVGEKTGSLIETMKKTSEYYVKEYIFKLKKLSEISEPILIIIMSIVVGFVVFSIAIPMFDSINALNY